MSMNVYDCLNFADGCKVMAEIIDRAAPTGLGCTLKGIEFTHHLDHERFVMEKLVDGRPVRYRGEVLEFVLPETNYVVRAAAPTPAYNGHGYYIVIDKRIFR